MATPDPNRPILNIACRYAPVGRCIYSRDGTPHCGPYGIEHIIPLSMEGRRELLEASCRTCATTIGKFETRFFRGTMETARDHLGLRGRQKIKNRKFMPVRFLDGAVISVPRDQHPSALVMPKLLMPGFMLGMTISNQVQWSGFVTISPATDDAWERSKRFGPNINLTRGFNMMDCYRQIAKIAHAYAVAELGLGGFAPLLLNLIHGIEPMLAGFLVGSALDVEPPTDNLHELSFYDSDAQIGGHPLIVVRVRLFAYLPDSPTHFAAVGIRPPAVPQREE